MSAPKKVLIMVLVALVTILICYYIVEHQIASRRIYYVCVPTALWITFEVLKIFDQGVDL